MPTRPVIIAIRILAAVVMVASVAALCNVMLWLPWQIDCVIAAAAAWGFAYKFEREDAL
jgi:hypothetical protein